jgi:hypothetical protein
MSEGCWYRLPTKPCTPKRGRVINTYRFASSVGICDARRWGQYPRLPSRDGDASSGRRDSSQNEMLCGRTSPVSDLGHIVCRHALDIWTAQSDGTSIPQFVINGHYTQNAWNGILSAKVNSNYRLLRLVFRVAGIIRLQLAY